MKSTLAKFVLLVILLAAVIYVIPIINMPFIICTENKIEEIKETAREDGYSDGYSDGYDEGTMDGYEDGYYDGECGELYKYRDVPERIPVVYYVSGGYCYHIDPNCEALKNSKNVRKAYADDVWDELKPCNLCTPHSDPY